MSQAASTLTSTWLSDEAILGIEPDTSAPGAGSPASSAKPPNGFADAADAELLSGANSASATTAAREAQDDPNRAADADANAPAAAQDADRAADTGRESAATAPPDGGKRDTSITIHALPAATLEQLDAAYYSPEPAARAQFAQTLFASDPAAFRAMFNEAARLLGVPVAQEQVGLPQESAQARVPVPPKPSRLAPGDSAVGAELGSARSTPEGIGANVRANADANASAPNVAPGFSPASPVFPVQEYRAFESATNDALSRDVRSAIGSTLQQVLPEGTAEGAARRIADDIYTDIGKQLASDAQLSAQVGEVLRGWRFGPAEQQQVNALLAGRARQLLPSAARRVIGEWTSSVLATARTRAARSEAASSHVDVGNAASRPAGNSEPARALKPKEIDYARMSDDDILSM